MQRGRPMLGKAEVSFNEFGLLDWYVVNKFPLRDRTGAVIGLIATIQKHPGLSHLPALGGEIHVAVEYIQAHLGEPLRVSELARLAHISPRQLERRFHAATGMSPSDFIIRARLAEACRQLRETALTIGEIALDTGFYDQSALTRLFRKHLGMTPGEFRRSRAHEPGA
jgi:transcriptional regulator GlxA family with amidase domain